LGLLSGTKNGYNSAAQLLFIFQHSLLTLDGFVYVADKEQGGTEAHHPEHQEECIADAGHVAKEEGCLHEARHIRSCIVVVQAVTIYKETG
jgi:hypothetical protein